MELLQQRSGWLGLNFQDRIRKQNVERLTMLTGLVKIEAEDLSRTTIVSIGGGPGDKICQPWFPRIAATTGAKVINFDISQPDIVDRELGLYEHVGGEYGNVFNLLGENMDIFHFLNSDDNISIIECNNMIGNNVSPDIARIFGWPNDIYAHPKLIELRSNLIFASQVLLAEGGILAIDNAFWRKDGEQLLPIDKEGYSRRTVFAGEK
ncbi:MAG: hypothetical protein AAB546_04600 [Patescibacteria group bacterium]